MSLLPTAMLTLMSPAWLLGLAAAVGLPVAAHLLSRVRYRPVAFPATRFVEQAVVEASQINRPRHLLLMLLRILALACVVLAFTRPQWQAIGATPPRSQGESLVIILDASASMHRSERGESLFDQARRQAVTALDTLDPARDRASVILADRSPTTLLPEPTANRALLRERLTQAHCTYESADLAGAIVLAHVIVQEQGRPGRILILSDGQQSSRPAGPLSGYAPGVPITEERIGATPANNVAVRLTDLSPYPPVLGSPVALNIELQHTGPSAQPITLHAQGAGDRASFPLTMQPGATTTQTIVLTPTQAGVQALHVWVEPGDAFDLDDEAGVVVEVAAARAVALYSDVSAGVDSTAARVSLALASVGEASAGVVVTRLEPGVLADSTTPSIGQAGCWVLTGIDAMPAGFGDTMRQHLDAGGGVLWVVDTSVARRAAHDLAFSPLRFDESAPGDAVVASVRFEHPALGVFEGPARASLVGQRFAQVAVALPSDGAEVLMRSADGRPILALQHVGRGRLIMVNADLAPSQTDFASQPAFVAWVNELTRFAAPGPGLPTPLYPGDPLPQSVVNQHTLQTPGHRETNDSDPARITAPGLYQGIMANGELASGVYATLDPAESDFTQSGAGDSDSGATLMQSGASGPALSGRRKPFELWPMCIVAALLFVGIESLALMSYAWREGGK